MTPTRPPSAADLARPVTRSGDDSAEARHATAAAAPAIGRAPPPGGIGQRLDITV